MKINDIKDRSMREHIIMRMRECYLSDMKRYLDGCHQLNADFGDTFPQFEEYCDLCNDMIHQIVNVRQINLDNINPEHKELIDDTITSMNNKLIELFHWSDVEFSETERTYFKDQLKQEISEWTNDEE